MVRGWSALLNELSRYFRVISRREYIRTNGTGILTLACPYVPGGYIAGRYKRYGDDTMDESFFPIVWQADGYRSCFLRDYCEDALAKPMALV